MRDGDFARYQGHLKKFAADDVRHVAVDIRYVNYDDGTGWSLGAETRQDPTDKRKWNILPPTITRSPLNLEISGLVSSLVPYNGLDFVPASFISRKKKVISPNMRSPTAAPMIPTCDYKINNYRVGCDHTIGCPTGAECWENLDGTVQYPAGDYVAGHLVDTSIFCVAHPQAANPAECNGCEAHNHPAWIEGCEGCSIEVCDSVDNDCDGATDEGTVCCSEETDLMCWDLGYGCGSWVDWMHDGQCKPRVCLYCYAQGGQYCNQNGVCQTPVVIDVQGNGFNLTNAKNGVLFDGIRVAWTAAGSDDSWLVLDRNGNNLINDGMEMFGAATSQPQPLAGEIGNGFIALAEFDKPENGGNGDNNINSLDAVFVRLELWRDINHNAISEPNELTPLPVSVIRVIELDYRESKRRDEHGNLFKYRAKVRDRHGAQAGRWAWDVFPVVQY